MTYTIPKKTKVETKLFSLLYGQLVFYLKDAAVLFGWISIALAIYQTGINSKLLIPYIVFVALAGIYLILPARKTNPDKRNYEAILMWIIHSRRTFRSENAAPWYDNKEVSPHA